MTIPFSRTADGVWRAPNLQQLAWLDHGFGTSLTTQWAPLDRLAMLKQIHSASVTCANAAGVLGEGDAIITSKPGLMVGVKTADCVPILLADTRNRVVAAIHAGWRGAAQSIVVAALREMGGNFGTQPADIVAAIGPCIGKCCYAVGPEVATKFQPWFPDINLHSPAKLDLAGANTGQLVNAGVESRHIAVSGICTFCAGSEFDSFRRDREKSGRMVSAIGVRPGD